MVRETLIRTAALMLLVGPLAVPGATQHRHGHALPAGFEHRPEVRAFLEEARQATARFQDLDVAIREGYVQVGPSMPSMGEHWVHLQRAMLRGIEARRPSVLTYLRVGESVVLTGVAFTHLAAAGEELPLFFGEAAWHFHSGSVDEEAYRIASHHHDDGTGMRLGMIHAWIWEPNPDGVFTGDNWTLPYRRLGLRPPDRVDPDASQALALADGGHVFVRQAVELALKDATEQQGVIDRLIERATRSVADLVAAAAGEPPEIADLQTVWRCLWDDVRTAVSEDAWHRLQVLAPADRAQGSCGA